MSYPSRDSHRSAVVRRNDYMAVRPSPDLNPTLTVSVVIPAYLDQTKLDLALAALAAQSYPSELLEVVIADDGSEPPLRLPALRPEHTRVVRTERGSWGIAAAVNTGVRASEGDVVLRLDSDVVPARRHVESHLRWHHVADYFTVLGKLMFVDVPAEELHPMKVNDAVAADEPDSLFEGIAYDRDWQIELIRVSGGRIDDETRAFTTANGATISFTRSMYDLCRGLDESMPLGSDTEFGYRLAQEGAVFVPEAEANAWHIGLSQMKSTKRVAGTRFRHQYMANRVPSLRYLRNRPGLNWHVPFVEVVVDATETKLEHVRATLSSIFGGSLTDVAAVLAGPWGSLFNTRVTPLDDPMLELRLLREAFSGDPRVSYREKTDLTAGPTPFRLKLQAGTVLKFDGLESLVEHADHERLGRVTICDDAGGTLAVLERTAAVKRALRLGLGESNAAIEHVWGTSAAPAEKWFRSGTGLDTSLHRARRKRALQRDLAQVRAEERRAYLESSRAWQLALRIRRGLGRRLRRLLPRH